MNIKSVHTASIIPIDPKKKVDGGIRSQSSAERDANGQQQAKEQELKRHLSQQEFDDALKALEANPGLKANGLTIKVEQDGDHRVIYILDPQGGIVRRLSESQLWLATRDKDRQTGKILDKAM
jgi:hypothetical protein